MFKSRALIWKAYKVRLKSPLTTLLDFVGPFVIIFIYLGLKYILSTSEDQTLTWSDSRHLHNKTSVKLKSDLKRYLCTDFLYYSKQFDKSQQLANYIKSECDVSLTTVNSRDELVKTLLATIIARSKARGPNLLRNSTTHQPNGCYKLPNNELPVYDFGLVVNDELTFEYVHADAAMNKMLHHYHGLGFMFDDQVVPQSSLNSGMYLIEICVSRAVSRLFKSKVKRRHLDNNNQPPVHQQQQQQQQQKQKKQTNAKNTSSVSIIKQKDSELTMSLQSFAAIGTSSVVPVMFLIMILVCFMCNAIVTVVRSSDDIESGLHRYIRLTGVTAMEYWSSNAIIEIIHMFIQSLLLAIVLGFPIARELFDPIYDSTFTFRWIIFFVYSVDLQMHSIFVGSMASKSSYALLTTCLLAICYPLCPALTFGLRYTPYGFTQFGYLINFLIVWNPVVCFESILILINAIATNSGETMSWAYTTTWVPGDELEGWTILTLIIILILQAIGWFLATIFFDQFFLSAPGINPITFIAKSYHEISCCNSNQKVKRSTAPTQNDQSNIDPNRICCSIDSLCVSGSKSMMYINIRNNTDKSHIQDASLMNTKEYSIARLQRERKSKFGNEFLATSSIFSTPLNHQTIDNIIQQKISWYSTRFSFNDLKIDFHFNQVSFILGIPDLKELFFKTLLGLHPINSGKIIIDDTIYTKETITLARPNIGYLSDRDVFINELTIFENLQFFGSLRDKTYQTYDSESSFVLSLLHLYNHRQSFPSVLTSRSSRKLSLAAAAVGRTKLLLLVEPTIGLRWKPRCHVLNLLKKYKSIRSIVVDTSDIDEACAFADRLVLLKNKKIDMEGSPQILSKRLQCGHWILFDYLGQESNYKASISALDKLTSDIFKDDKLGKLDNSLRSIYQDLIDRFGSKTSASERTDQLAAEELHRQATILKIQQSRQSSRSICKLLKIFATNNIYGFKLSGLDYESLEDVMVVRLSKGSYPDLPPELLLSLQQRTSFKPQREISVRAIDDDERFHDYSKTDLEANFKRIVYEKLLFSEIIINVLALILAISIVAISMSYSRLNIPDSYDSATPISIDSIFTSNYYGNRTSLMIRDSVNINEDNNQGQDYNYDYWRGKMNLVDTWDKPSNLTEEQYLKKMQVENKDLTTNYIVYNNEQNSVHFIYEPFQPFALVNSIQMFTEFYDSNRRSQLTNEDDDKIKTPKKIQTSFAHPWHAMVRGLYNKRFCYGVGFALAEGILTGTMAMWSVMHKPKSLKIKAKLIFWLSVATVDFSFSLIAIAAYMILFIFVEKVTSIHMLGCMFLILFLYKLAAIPLAYLCAIATSSRINAFLIMMLVQFTMVWVFGIHMRVLFDWNYESSSYWQYIGLWLVTLFPTNAVVHGIVTIAHMTKVNKLCPTVPAFTMTIAIFPDRDSTFHLPYIIETLFDKIRECLNNEKAGIDEDVLNSSELGILIDIYLLLLFGILAWAFLIFSEQVFGRLAQSSISTKNSDPLKTMIRTDDSTSLSFKWVREKDRLVGDYVRCLNEPNYVKHMANNCIFIRVWLRPLTDQNSLNRNIHLIVDPVLKLGQAREHVRIELKTTLQIFIRVGGEKYKHGLDKIQLIDAYLKFQKDHKDTIQSFAVTDWRRETLYKILLHGHYNAKSVNING